MKIDTIRESVGTLWESVAEGWERLRGSASGAMTKYGSGDIANLPAHEEIDDANYLPNNGWAILGGDVFEDDKRILVRIEVPGVNKNDFAIEVLDDVLLVRGEKRFEREGKGGRWRMLQCAYGSFLRSVPLPAPVNTERSRATYRDGVLKVELPKAAPGQPGKPRVTQVHIG